MNIDVDPLVEEFIRSLEKPTVSKVARLIDLLEKFGNNLSMPYSKKISKNFFELRIRGSQEVRIFYAFYKGKAILLHGFVKKTQKTPLKEIETAAKRLRRLTEI